MPNLLGAIKTRTYTALFLYPQHFACHCPRRSDHKLLPYCQRRQYGGMRAGTRTPIIGFGDQCSAIELHALIHISAYRCFGIAGLTFVNFFPPVISIVGIHHACACMR